LVTAKKSEAVKANKKTIMKQSAKPKPKGLIGAQPARLVELVNYQDSAIVSCELVKKPTGTVTIFAFDEEQALSEHTAPFDALVQVLEGEVKIVISGKPHHLAGGELILMPAQQPHALKAFTRFKMLLTMIRS
jgi:quercetin dioxygenase-like cupin family protein